VLCAVLYPVLHGVLRAACCAAAQGVGDGKSNDFSGFQYSPHVANVIKPANLRPANDTWHPQIDDVVYWGMDWVRTTVAFLEPFLCVLKTIVLPRQARDRHRTSC
jgi:hypothetical protein